MGGVQVFGSLAWQTALINSRSRRVLARHAALVLATPGCETCGPRKPHRTERVGGPVGVAGRISGLVGVGRSLADCGLGCGAKESYCYNRRGCFGRILRLRSCRAELNFRSAFLAGLFSAIASAGGLDSRFELVRRFMKLALSHR